MTAPPLGNLRGMYWDPEKNRYFPLSLSKVSKPQPPTPKRKRTWDVNESAEAQRRLRGVSRCRHGRGIGGGVGGGGSGNDGRVGRVGSLLSGYERTGQYFLCRCSEEKVTSISHFGNGAAVTSDSGQVILGTEEGKMVFSVCSQRLLGIHCDVARGTWLAVANGNEPHIHIWRHCFDVGHWPLPMLEHITLDIPRRDIFAMSSISDMTTLALTRSLNSVVTSEDALSFNTRRMPSDPLKVHQYTRDIVFAGLRNSSILMEDLRTPSGKPNVITTLPRGRAVTGIKRLQDSAVPWGLLASGLDNQLVIYDLRFPKQPLRELADHVNVFHTTLGMATSPDDTVVFHGGCDKRLRAWSTVTGQRIRSTTTSRTGLLNVEYWCLVEHIDVADDLTVRVGLGEEVARFGGKVAPPLRKGGAHLASQV